MRTYLLLKENNVRVKSFIDSSDIKQKMSFDEIGCISFGKYIEQYNKEDIVIVAINDNSVYEKLRDVLSCEVIYFRNIEKQISRTYKRIKGFDELLKLRERFGGMIF